MKSICVMLLVVGLFMPAGKAVAGPFEKLRSFDLVNYILQDFDIIQVSKDTVCFFPKDEVKRKAEIDTKSIACVKFPSGTEV